MRNKDKRLPHYSLEEAIEKIKPICECVEQKIILTILYEIYDIKEQITTMDDEMRGYYP